jgi:hypothetical protein
MVQIVPTTHKVLMIVSQMPAADQPKVQKIKPFRISMPSPLPPTGTVRTQAASKISTKSNCWRSQPNPDAVAKKCAEHYQKAIDLGFDEAQVRYYWGFHDLMWKQNDQAIAHFERAIEIAGRDSTIGTEAAKFIERAMAQKNDKSGMCFIATAACESAQAPEVQVLRSFRDQILLRSPLGQAFVRFYYLTSPPVARFLSRHPVLRRIVRYCVVRPLANHCDQRMTRRVP